MTTSKPIIDQRRVVIGAFFFLNLLLLLLLADRNGYEGDDLNSIAPMLHLGEAKNGYLEIYRYHWQPLSYEIGAAAYRIFGNPDAIFLMAPVAAAISLALLLAICWPRSSPQSGAFGPIIALLALPEIWFSGLYYNSTILGLPFLLMAFLLLAGRDYFVTTLLAAVLTCLAIFMRLDFALVVPGLMFVAWRADGSIAKPSVYIAAVIATLAVALLIGFLRPDLIWESYLSASRELAARSTEPGWDLRTKLLVISTTLSPIGWLIVVIGGPLALLHSIRRAPWATAVAIIAMAPLVLPMRNLLSVKYALPFFVFLAIFLTQCLSSIERVLPASYRFAIRSALVVGTTILMFVSVSVYGKPPYLTLGALASRPIETHDGPRSYGGYLWQMAAVNQMATPSDREIRARQLFDEILDASGPDLVFVGDENYFSLGGVGWRHLQLMLEQAGFRGRLIAPHTLQFDIGPRRLTLLREFEGNASLPPFDRGGGVKLHDFRDPKEQRR